MFKTFATFYSCFAFNGIGKIEFGPMIYTLIMKNAHMQFISLCGNWQIKCAQVTCTIANATQPVFIEDTCTVWYTRLAKFFTRIHWCLVPLK